MSGRASVIERAWRGLLGTWHLTRRLESINAAEPSGSCTGLAVFTARQPTIFVDSDGKLQTALAEMLYAESGEFEMVPQTTISSPAKFSFSRKYVWRLQGNNEEHPQITIWFTKPGTEQIDYLFHKFSVQDISEQLTAGQLQTSVDCTGGHLCVEDFYSSSYSFLLEKSSSRLDEDSLQLNSWKMLHEVRGPKKDQVIETSFQRPTTS